MDLLLSIPVLTYFFAPSPPSWATSLNLMFFYMTWTTLVLAHSPLRLHAGGVLAIRLVLWLLPSLLSLVLDTSLPGLAASMRHGGDSHASGSGSGSDNITRTWTSMLRARWSSAARLAALATVNMLVMVAVEAACSRAQQVLLLGGGPVFRTSTTLPLPWQVAKHVALLLVLRETLQYYTHRFLLHHDRTTTNHYRRFSSFSSIPVVGAVAAAATKLHARYAHSGAASALRLMADHPLPLLLHRFVPLYAPAALLVRPHLLTYLVFVAVCTLEETLAMSGYAAIVPGFIMGGIARRCAVHYAAVAAGHHHHVNFGTYGILDWIHGTARGGSIGVLQDLAAEAEKRQVPKQGRRQAK